jgi:hypothetical protein
MKQITHFFLMLSLAIAMTACSSSSEDDGGKTSPTPTVAAETQQLTIDGVDDTTWVYVSLATCKVMGSSTLGDAAGDALWAARTDWDVAFCGELIRTNGGTSGSGKAALQLITNKSYNALDTAPEDGYLADTDDQVIRQ